MRLAEERTGLLAILAVALAGMRAMWLMTAHGAAFFSDGDIYIATARSLHVGLGFTIPSALGLPVPELRFPPGFPAALCVLLGRGADVFQTARRLNTGLFGLNITLSGWLAYRASGRSWALGTAAAALTTASIDMLFVHGTILSEPLFLSLTLGGLGLLMAHGRSRSRAKVAAAAALLGLSPLVRFVGVAWIGAGVLYLAWIHRTEARERLKVIILFAIASAAPIFLWLLHNHAAAGSFTSRDWYYTSPFTAANARHLEEIFLLWTSQGRPSGWWIAAAIALAVGIIRKSGLALGSAAPADEAGLMIFGLVYPAFMAVMMCSTEPALMTESTRYFTPLHLMLLALLLGRTTPLTRHPKVSVRLCFWLFLVSLWALHAAEARRWSRRFPNDSLGYASAAWSGSPLIAWIETASPKPVLYTNAAAPVLVYAGRGSALLPQKTRMDTGKKNEYYGLELKEMLRRLRERQALLVLFDKTEDSYDMPSTRELAALLPLRRLFEASDGVVLEAAD